MLIEVWDENKSVDLFGNTQFTSNQVGDKMKIINGKQCAASCRMQQVNTGAVVASHFLLNTSIPISQVGLSVVEVGG